MDRNEIIGKAIGKSLGYLVQGFAYAQIAQVANVPSVFLVRTAAKSSMRMVRYVSKEYIRKDFSSEAIFSDAIDATFSAY